jgi:hypothetical protein
MAIMQAAKGFPDSAGTAFRMRTMSRKRRNLNGLNSNLQQCFYTERNGTNRCKNICIPRSSLCATHIGYNVDQKAFMFCKTPCCGKPVSKVNSLVFNGMCEEHYLGKPTTTVVTNGRSSSYPNQSQQFPTAQQQAAYRQAHPEIGSSSTTNKLASSYSDKPEHYADNQLIHSISMDDFNVSDGKPTMNTI